MQDEPACGKCSAFTPTGRHVKHLNKKNKTLLLFQRVSSMGNNRNRNNVFHCHSSRSRSIVKLLADAS